MSTEIVIKPWGQYEVLSAEDGIKYKKIIVMPGQSLSLQSHEHRSELWVVMLGVASITIDDKTFSKGQKDWVIINRLQKHRIANDTDSLLIFYELAFGSVVDENDITRYEDVYGRI